MGGDFKAYCGPQSASDMMIGSQSHACSSGPYACAFIEHFAAFAPAFGRRPYYAESEGAVVIKTDYSLAGEALVLHATLNGSSIFGPQGSHFIGGEQKLFIFSLNAFPPHLSERVNITLVRADGRVATKPRRFLRDAHSSNGGIRIQIDHERGGPCVCVFSYTYA